MFSDPNVESKYQAICDLKPHLRSRDGTLPIEWNELGMSDAFSQVFGNECRYVPEWKSWVVYDGIKWSKDEQGILVGEKIKLFTRLLSVYAREITDGTKEDYVKFVNKIEDRRYRNRIKDDAAGVCATSAWEFDNNPYLLNCLNGTYDLSTLELHEHNPHDYLTMCTRFEVNVNKSVSCPRFEQFIDEITSGNKEKADFLQRALGYSLLGKSNEECLFISYGKTTRNGKSTLHNTIEEMLGDYSTSAPVGLICRDRNQAQAEGASPVLASLKGKRFVTMAESEDYGRLDEAKIKSFTGGEAITARALFAAPITFLPQFTIWLSCNDLPAVSDKSLFSSERLRVISFDKHFSQKEQDKGLKDFFTQPENMSGIFNWLVYGYREYVNRKLVMSDDMKAVIASYEGDNDYVGQFLNQRACKGEYQITAKELYRHFVSWCKEEHIGIMAGRRFVNEMARHPEWYSECIVETSGRTYKGLSLKALQGGS